MRYPMLAALMLLATDLSASPAALPRTGDGVARPGEDKVTVVRFKDGEEVLCFTVTAEAFYGGPTPLLPVPAGATDPSSEDNRRIATPAAPPTNEQTSPGDEVTTVLARDVPGEGRYQRRTTYRFDCRDPAACRWSRVENAFEFVAADPRG